MLAPLPLSQSSAPVTIVCPCNRLPLIQASAPATIVCPCYRLPSSAPVTVCPCNRLPLLQSGKASAPSRSLTQAAGSLRRADRNRTYAKQLPTHSN
eukprot:352641-Chlamydomonas_euryale.AAC.2